MTEQKWEYMRTESFSDLQKLGLQGWELVSVVQPIQTGSRKDFIEPHPIVYIVKRKLVL